MGPVGPPRNQIGSGAAEIESWTPALTAALTLACAGSEVVIVFSATEDTPDAATNRRNRFTNCPPV
jgi:hypothetical protein